MGRGTARGARGRISAVWRAPRPCGAADPASNPCRRVRQKKARGETDKSALARRTRGSRKTGQPARVRCEFSHKPRSHTGDRHGTTQRHASQANPDQRIHVRGGDALCAHGCPGFGIGDVSPPPASTEEEQQEEDRSDSERDRSRRRSSALSSASSVRVSSRYPRDLPLEITADPSPGSIPMAMYSVRCFLAPGMSDRRTHDNRSRSEGFNTWSCRLNRSRLSRSATSRAYTASRSDWPSLMSRRHLMGAGPRAVAGDGAGWSLDGICCDEHAVRDHVACCVTLPRHVWPELFALHGAVDGAFEGWALVDGHSAALQPHCNSVLPHPGTPSEPRLAFAVRDSAR